MYCSNCGTLLDNNAKFCVACGTSVTADNNRVFSEYLIPNNLQNKENERLKKDIQVALPIYAQLGMYAEKIDTLEYKKNSIISIKKFILLFVALFFPCYAGIMFLSNFEISNYTFTGVFYLDILLIVIRTITKRNKLGNEIKKVRNEAQLYFRDVNCDELYSLPEKYQYSLAATYILECLNTGRASNLKEAMNLYEEQLHRWQMELNQQHITNELARQQQMYNRAQSQLNILGSLLLMK